MNNRKPALALLLITSGLLTAGPAIAKTMFRLKDLGALATTPGSSASYGFDINDQGQVVGYTYVDAVPYPLDHAFVTDNSSAMLDIGSLVSDRSSTATAINNNGVVAGYSIIDGNKRAFITDANNSLIDLGTLGGQESRAYGINDKGQVTGYSELAKVDGYFPETHAFLTTINGAMTDLGTLPGGNSSYGNAINASGQVTGYASTVADDHAFITDADGLNMRDLNVPSISSKGLSINTSGQVVGRAALEDGSITGFVTAANGLNPRLLELPNEIEGFASAINDDGIFTGAVSDGTFVSDSQGNIKLISSLLIDEDSTKCSTVSVVNAINNLGQITGACLADIYRNVHAFILTPEEVAEPRIPARKTHGDSIKLSESQKDTVQCDKAKNCSQLTSGSYSLTLKLSADTLENNRIDLGKLTRFTAFSINIGSFGFSGTFNTAAPDKKTGEAPTTLPATWTASHSLCTKYASDGTSCSKSKTVIDGTVKISSDKKHGLTVSIKGKKSVIDGEDVGQQLYAAACQANPPGNSSLTESAEISIDDWPIPLPLKISCKLKQSTKTVAGTADGPFTLNNISLKAELTTAP